VAIAHAGCGRPGAHVVDQIGRLKGDRREITSTTTITVLGRLGAIRLIEKGGRHRAEINGAVGLPTNRLGRGADWFPGLPWQASQKKPPPLFSEEAAAIVFKCHLAVHLPLERVVQPRAARLAVLALVHLHRLRDVVDQAADALCAGRVCGEQRGHAGGRRRALDLLVDAWSLGNAGAQLLHRNNSARDAETSPGYVYNNSVYVEKYTINEAVLQ